MKTTTVQTVKRGRPINPDSARQAKLRLPKTGRTGRPINEESARQKRLAAKANGEIKRGRPIDVTSESYKKRLKREELIAQGIEIKRGRPAFKKDGLTSKTRINPNWKQDKNGKWRDEKGHFIKKELLEMA